MRMVARVERGCARQQHTCTRAAAAIKTTWRTTCPPLRRLVPSPAPRPTCAAPTHTQHTPSHTIHISSPPCPLRPPLHVALTWGKARKEETKAVPKMRKRAGQTHRGQPPEGTAAAGTDTAVSNTTTGARSTNTMSPGGEMDQGQGHPHPQACSAKRVERLLLPPPALAWAAVAGVNHVLAARHTRCRTDARYLCLLQE